MRRLSRTAALTAVTLGLLAGDIATLSFTPTAAEAHWRRGGGFGYGVGYGYGGRYGGYGYYHRNRVSAGEVIATVAVVGAAVAAAVVGQGCFEVPEHPDVVDDQPVVLVGENPVRSCAGLHEGVVPHRLVEVDRRARGNVACRADRGAS